MPELRKDPITGRWVIISTDRAKRPTDFLRESVRIEGNGFCHPFCYGNESKNAPEILAYGRNCSLVPTAPAGACVWCPTSSRRLASKAI